MQPTFLTGDEVARLANCIVELEQVGRPEHARDLRKIMAAHAEPRLCGVCPTTAGLYFHCQLLDGHRGAHGWASSDNATSVTWVNSDG